jgi:hypothetical protein
MGQGVSAAAMVPGPVVVVHDLELEDTNAPAATTFDHSSGHPVAVPVLDPEGYSRVRTATAALVAVESSSGERPVPQTQSAVSCSEGAVDQLSVHSSDQAAVADKKALEA